MKKNVKGLYIYQPFGIDKDPYIFGIANIKNNTCITGLTRKEAEIIIEIISKTRIIEINKSLDIKLEKKPYKIWVEEFCNSKYNRL